jgi:hypothetical protein
VPEIASMLNIAIKKQDKMSVMVFELNPTETDSTQNSDHILNSIENQTA